MCTDLHKIKGMLGSPLIYLPALLFALLAISLLFHDNSYGLKAVSKYKKLLLILPIALFFLEHRSLSTLFWRGFLIANGIILITTVISGTLNLPIGDITPDNPTVFKLHITQNFFMALSALLWIALALHSTTRRLRWAYALLAALACYSIFFLVLGRTGYIAMLAGIACWILVSQSPRRKLLAAVLGILLAIAFMQIPNPASERIMEGVHEVQSCLDADRSHALAACGTSMGQRTAFLAEAIHLIKQAPLLGHGAGSFHYENSETGYEISNPHNEFLNQTISSGLLGLSIFLAWLICCYRSAWNQPKPVRNMLVAILTSYLASMLFNSLIMDAAEGYLFIILIASIASLQAQHLRADSPLT